MAKAAAAIAKKQLQLDGYTAFIKALAANNLNWKHEKLMLDVRTELSITQEQHIVVIEKVMTDPEVTAIREGKPIPPKPKPQDPQLMPIDTKGKKAKGAPAPALPAAVTPKGGKKGKKVMAASPPVPPQQWIGRVVDRAWGSTWLSAVVAEYDAGKDMHRLLYHPNTSQETSEWYQISHATPNDFRPTDMFADLSQVISLARGKAAQAGPVADEDQPLTAVGKKRKLQAAKTAGKAQASVPGPSIPDGFLAKVKMADEGELGSMMANLRRQEAQIKAELLEIGEPADNWSEEMALARLTKEWNRLSGQETELHQRILALQ